MEAEEKETAKNSDWKQVSFISPLFPKHPVLPGPLAGEPHFKGVGGHPGTVFLIDKPSHFLHQESLGNIAVHLLVGGGAGGRLVHALEKKREAIYDGKT